VSVDHPKLSRPVTLRWKTCENYLGHEVAGLLVDRACSAFLLKRGILYPEEDL
jgi:hypothetical protein